MLELIIFIMDIEFYSTSLATRHSSNKFGSALAARSVRAMLSTILPHLRPPAARKDRRPLIVLLSVFGMSRQKQKQSCHR